MEKEKEERGEIQEEGNEKLNDSPSQSIPVNEETEQIEKAFGEEIEYEEIAGVESSPMNEAVKQGEVSEGKITTNEQTTDEGKSAVEAENAENDLPPELLKEFENDSKPPTDAPEQEINASEELEDAEPNEEAETLEVKSGLSDADHHAGIAADSLIGVADNLLETGGGFFITIKKSKNYYDFDKKIGFDKADPNSLSAKIDEFNERNIKRIKLDAEDKRQLKPVLREVLKRQTKAMTPEQQLMALGISILVKKGKAVIEMRNESKALKNHFDDVVKEYLQKMETINVEVVEKEEEGKVVEFKAEEDGEEREDHQIKAAA